MQQSISLRYVAPVLMELIGCFRCRLDTSTLRDTVFFLLVSAVESRHSLVGKGARLDNVAVERTITFPDEK